MSLLQKFISDTPEAEHRLTPEILAYEMPEITDQGIRRDNVVNAAVMGLDHAVDYLRYEYGVFEPETLQLVDYEPAEDIAVELTPDMPHDEVKVLPENSRNINVQYARRLVDAATAGRQLSDIYKTKMSGTNPAGVTQLNLPPDDQTRSNDDLSEAA